MKETFSKKIQDIMGKRIPEFIPRGKWQGKTYLHILPDIKTNFIDGDSPQFCSVKGNLTKAEIKYHQGAAHMNSSQVACISFFKKFFEKAEYEGFLLEILRDAGITIAKSDEIESAAFEYEPCIEERTNFDFYMVLKSGIRISFEIKYTEAEFGGISPDKDDPDKYDRKWNTIYKEMVEKSAFLNVDKDTFYKPHYQVNRNIVYANSQDYVVFLTPRANDAHLLEEGRKYIDAMNNPHILNIYWEDIVGSTMNKVMECDDLREYFTKFYQKYIEILKW